MEQWKKEIAQLETVEALDDYWLGKSQGMRARAKSTMVLHQLCMSRLEEISNGKKGQTNVVSSM